MVLIRGPRQCGKTTLARGIASSQGYAYLSFDDVGAERAGGDCNALGQLLETLVFQELRRQASWRDDDIRFHHFRDKDGVEVDRVWSVAGASWPEWR